MYAMRLKELIKNLDVISIAGNTDVEVAGIAYNSRKVVEGGMFVCIDGFSTDGHKFAEAAIENGAKSLLVEKDMYADYGIDYAKNPDITIIKVADTRHGLAAVSAAFFSYPSTKLNLIGVTGTKGKTTTTFMIRNILNQANYPNGLVGSVAKYVLDKEYDIQRTTPESYDLQMLMSEMVKASCKFAVVEVASQGIKLKRIDFCDFDIGVFTNLYRDHIAPSEHSDMNDYFYTKKQLFDKCKVGFVNIDSEYADIIINDTECIMYTFGINYDADISAYHVAMTSEYSEFRIRLSEQFKRRIRFSDKYADMDSKVIRVDMPGSYNIYNALAAIAVCMYYNISFESIVNGLSSVKVKGRGEKVETGKDFTVIIDHAHNTDSLESVIQDFNKSKKGRLICLFGCGGDRSKERRPGMGRSAGENADFSIITSDNPRSEDPIQIMKDIEEGIKKTDGKYVMIENRRDAIKYALEIAKKDDIILLAGKGDEMFQEFADGKIEFDERKIVKELLGIL
jgi:UDP-N-acetylmuramoyl-L-alanyl-D-glutamate--2,6-diaminopimelate ligase